MHKLLLISVSTFLASVVSTNAAETFLQDKNWTITLERDKRQCIALPNNDASGFVGVFRNEEHTNISVLDTKLTWLKNGTGYEATVFIDRSRWTGNMMAEVSGNTGALHVYGAVPRFLEAFAKGNRMSLTVEGATYGPYTLAGTSKLLSDLDDCVSAIKNPAQPPAATSTDLWVGKNSVQSWSPADIGKVFNLGDRKVQLSKRNRPDGTEAYIVDVTDPQNRNTSFEIDGGDNVAGNMSLVDFEWGGESVVFTNFTGGTHCCTEVRAVNYPNQFEAKLVEIGRFDAGEIKPEDIDGDGLYEIPVPDERFRRLTAYALSNPPIQILKIREGKVIDASTEPAYAQLHERHFKSQSEQCEVSIKENPGACAGMLGTAAILGDFEAAAFYLEMDDKPDETAFSTKVCIDENCKVTKQYSGFKEVIVESFKAWGYLSEKPDQEYAEWTRKLIGREFALGNAGETSCDGGQAVMKEEKGFLGNPVFLSTEYESGCIFSAGSVIGGTTMAFRGFCSGEGSAPLAEHLIYALEGDIFTRTTFTGFPPRKDRIFKLKECPKKPQ